MIKANKYLFERKNRFLYKNVCLKKDLGRIFRKYKSYFDSLEIVLKRHPVILV